MKRRSTLFQERVTMRDRSVLGGVTIVLTSVVAALGLWAIMAGSTPHALLARSYTQSLDSVPTAWERRLTGELWLSHAPASDASQKDVATAVQPLRQALSVGDQIKISSRAGGEETIEVTALEGFDGDAVGLAGLQLQVVTGKPVGGASRQVVRFLFAVDAPAVPALPKSDRSL
jgi:hypothetical protein